MDFRTSEKRGSEMQNVVNEVVGFVVSKTNDWAAGWVGWKVITTVLSLPFYHLVTFGLTMLCVYLVLREWNKLAK